MIIIVPQRLEKLGEDGYPTQRLHAWMVDMTNRQTLESDGNPEGLIEGVKLQLCIDTTNDVLYYKSTETGKTGWKSL